MTKETSISCSKISSLEKTVDFTLEKYKYHYLQNKMTPNALHACMSRTTCKTLRANSTKVTPSMIFGVFLDALSGSELTEDEETTAASGAEETTRAGGVMERLIHGTGPV